MTWKVTLRKYLQNQAIKNPFFGSITLRNSLLINMTLVLCHLVMHLGKLWYTGCLLRNWWTLVEGQVEGSLTGQAACTQQTRRRIANRASMLPLSMMVLHGKVGRSIRPMEEERMVLCR